VGFVPLDRQKGGMSMQVGERIGWFGALILLLLIDFIAAATASIVLASFS